MKHTFLKLAIFSCVVGLFVLVFVSCFSSKKEEDSKSEMAATNTVPSTSEKNTATKEQGPPENPNKELKISDGLTQQQVNTVFQDNSQEIRQCYEKYLKKKKNASGQITINLVVNADGRVATTKIVSSKVGDKKMKQCVVKNIKRWSFPKPREVESVSVTYPIVLNPN